MDSFLLRSSLKKIMIYSKPIKQEKGTLKSANSVNRRASVAPIYLLDQSKSTSYTEIVFASIPSIGLFTIRFVAITLMVR